MGSALCRPVFLGVLPLLACGGTAPAPAPAPASTIPSATAPTSSSAPVSTTRKRTRTAASRAPAHDGTKPKNGHPVNPKDPSGRTVFVAADDRCFVEVPSAERNADGTLVRGTENVDCPPAMDDPAWDHCTAQIVVEEVGSTCFCVSGAPPRPMPHPTPCPASARAAK